MPCNAELYKVQLRVWIKKGKNPQTGKNVTEAIDFDDIAVGLDKAQTQYATDFGCFKSFFSIVEKNKAFWAGIEPDPNPLNTDTFGRLLTAMKNSEVLPAAFLYIKRRDLADDVGSPSRIGVYMEKVRIPFTIGSLTAITAESASSVGF